MNCHKLQSHIAKLRKRKALWQQVGSQAVQDICQRIEKAYQLFVMYWKAFHYQFENGVVRPVSL